MDLGKLLEGHEKKDEILSYFQTEIEKASFEGSKKANSEAKNVRERFKKNWSAFDLDPDSSDFEEKLLNLKDSLEDYKALKSGDKKNPEILKLQRDLEKITQTLEAEKKEKESLKKANFSKSVKEMVHTAIMVVFPALSISIGSSIS